MRHLARLIAPCDGCGVTVSVYDLSQADETTAPCLCLVCTFPEYYCYEGLPE